MGHMGTEVSAVETHRMPPLMLGFVELQRALEKKGAKAVHRVTSAVVKEKQRTHLVELDSAEHQIA